MARPRAAGTRAASAALAGAHQRLTALFDRGEDVAGRAAAQALVAANEQDAFAWKVLGTIEVRLGETQAGVAALRRALALAPKDASVLNSLGRAHADLGDPAQAEQYYRRALALVPGYPEAQRNLGNLLLSQDAPQAALAAFEQAIARRPGYVAAHIDRGLALRALGRFDEALQACETALRLDPRSARAHCNRGSLLFHQSRSREAVQAYDAALALDPNLVEAHYNRGNALHRLGQLRAAEAAFRRALALDASLAMAHNNLGNTLQLLGRLDEAEAAHEQARRLNPVAFYTDSNRLFGFNYRDDVARETVFAAHRAYAQPAQAPVWRAAPGEEARRRLRVGLVSADFAIHSVAFFLSAWLEHHGREAVELFAYANGERTDAMTHWCRARVAHWVPCAALDDHALAARIAADRIDVLVDLAGHSGKNRLPVFAERAAPVQVTWLGYPNTTGLTAMDYRLVDAVTDPPEADAFHSERLLRLPDGFLCYRPPEPVRNLQACQPPSTERSSLTFVSFNNLAKLGPGILARWARILIAVPGSRLMLKSGLAADVRVWDTVIEQLARAGVAAERIEGLPRTPRQADHFPWYHQADIALDTFPYNGTTTTVEALWMGVPVVTECGDRHAARVGASILTRLELPELIAQDADDYVRIVVELAQDPERLRRYRATLRPRLEASALRDEVGFTRTFEWALREMWRIHCAGEAPRVFEVPSQRDPNQPTPTQAAERALAEGALERLAPTPPMPDAMPSQSPMPSPDTHWTLTIADEVKVCVPPDVRRMTAYVLLEQEDWFEAELPFLRELVQPGMGVLDIGANHGLYALSLAKRLRGQGRVIACEPASAPADMLKRSIAANGFGDVLTLLRVGLSDHQGEATLTIGANSELNTLNAEAGAAPGQTETVRLTTLDALLDSANWPAGFQVDVLKLDAEGEEIRILQGGAYFFAEQNPLVLFEWKHGNAPNTGLLEAFAALGYDRYRLVPGLQALAPVLPDEELDGYQLNLFACKPSRAAQLQASGWLLTSAEVNAEAPAPVRRWAEALQGLPFVASIKADGATLPAWQRLDRAGDVHWAQYEAALDACLSAADAGQSLSARWAWLRHSRARLEQLAEAGDAHLATILLRIRVLSACGERAAAAKLNGKLIKVFDQQRLQVKLDRPFLPPSARFDDCEPRAMGKECAMAAWLRAAMHESRERLRAHSSYFQCNTGLFRQLGANPNRSFEMDRRIALQAWLTGAPMRLDSTHPLRAGPVGPAHRNRAWWQRVGKEVRDVCGPRRIGRPVASDGYRWVFCAGMQRSGSTWSYNVTRHLMAQAKGAAAVTAGYCGEGRRVDARLNEQAAVAGYHVLKFHGATSGAIDLAGQGAAKVIVTYRPPMNAVASMVDFFGAKLEHAVGQIIRSIDDMRRWRATGHALFIAFDDLMLRDVASIRRIARFLDVKAADEVIERIARETSFSATQQRAEALDSKGAVLIKAGDSHYDPESLLHVGHAPLGQDRDWRRQLTAEQQAYALKALDRWIDAGGGWRPDAFCDEEVGPVSYQGRE
nr:FkbM family methyltransferase [Thiorhodovibrio winogradskyi]